MAQSPPVRARMPGPAARVAEVVMASLFVTVEQVGVISHLMKSSGHPPVPPLVQPPAESEPDWRKAAEDDPLVGRAREYAKATLGIMQALRPSLQRGGDARSIDAGERLEETCLTVASKVHRAVASASEPDLCPNDPQGDSNGSAKIALLLIDESREAWRVLMRPGYAVGNGAPARFIVMLDEIEAGIRQRFPRALEFIRPGFDTLSTPRTMAH